MTTSVDAPPAATDDLILLRMALPSVKPVTGSIVRKDVGNLLLGRALLPEEFTTRITDLVNAGFVTTKGKSIGLTESGRTRAMAYLGLHEFLPKTNWTTLKSKHFLAKALGMSTEAANRLDTGAKLAAFFLKRKYDLPPDAGSTVPQVLEAIVCKKIGHAEITSFDGLLRAILNQHLGGEQLDKAALIKQFPLFETGLTSTKAEDVRLALIREGLMNGSRKPASDPEPEPPAEFDLAAFAATVKAIARTSPEEDRFYENKAYISAVWRASQREDGFPRLALADFKQHLIEANGAGLLRLSRADLVQAMPPALVADSETEYLNATFHFVLIEEGRP